MTDGRRWLIVNADDFGQSPAINRGVATAFEHGIVTSASLMVRWPASSAAADYARQHPTLSLGLHFDFGEWSYRSDEWLPVYRVDMRDLKGEVRHQLETFQALTGQDPTHLDSHQHVHREEPLRSVLHELASRLDVPLRDFDPRVRYDGSFYGQSNRGYPVPGAIEASSLVRLIETLPPGVTELGCHPGEPDHTFNSMYRAERAQEVQALCDPGVRERIQSAGVHLCSFRDLRVMMPA